MEKKENKRINLHISENVYNQLKKIKSQNKTESLNKTVGLILKQYFIKEGIFDDSVNNVFLNNNCLHYQFFVFANLILYIL